MVGKKSDLRNSEVEPAPPKLVSRRDNKKSTLKLGRTIGEKRERLETANERAYARKKDKKKKALRVVLTVAGFIILAGILIYIGLSFINKEKTPELTDNSNEEPLVPSIEIVDEDSASTSGKITTRMKTYIAETEVDFREKGYTPTKAVIPTGAIREVDFTLEEVPGVIKTVIDRGSGVTVEDADRMIRYLSEKDITDYDYIDVRIDGKAYWK
ncbi:hypothetical protein IJH72_02105 [Candidatus Saccharibacteria bacterium]|nr:hypothetical protein [Candidatus Saccharibacteria bacterium]